MNPDSPALPPVGGNTSLFLLIRYLLPARDIARNRLVERNDYINNLLYDLINQAIASAMQFGMGEMNDEEMDLLDHLMEDNSDVSTR